MFILSCVRDTVKLLPSTEYSPAAITHWLNAKYANRVLHKIGLCISVYDLLSVGDGALKYGDGAIYVQSLPSPPYSVGRLIVADFRLVVFCPCVGEVLTGRIMAATHAGIRLSLEFFDDVFIPAHLIFSIAHLYIALMWYV